MGGGESFVVPSFKKGLRSHCANHRGISLIPITSKLLSSTIVRRLYNTHEGQTREEPNGSCAGRGCVDQILIIRQVLENRSTFQGTTVTVFLDNRIAFDSVDVCAL